VHRTGEWPNRLLLRSLNSTLLCPHPTRCRLHTNADAAAEAAADALVQKALQAGTSDNVTAIVMLFDWQGSGR